MTCSLLALLTCFVMPLAAEDKDTSSQIAIRDAIKLLQARQNETAQEEEKKKIKAAIAALQTLLPANKDARQKELKRLEGKWAVKRSEQDGQLNTIGEDRLTIIIEGDVIQYLLDNRRGHKSRISLDPTKEPMTMDLERMEGGYAGNMELCMYRWLDDNTIEICYGKIGDKKKRPKKFTTEPNIGSGWELVRYQRLTDDD